MSAKRGRPTLRKSGVPFSETERKRRYRRNLKRRVKAKIENERQSRRLVVNGKLGVRQLDIAAITDADLASNTVDAVITDPPWAEVPLFETLAIFAMRVLKPGGWCLAMSGDLFLDRILPLMAATGLTWRGLITVDYCGGAHGRLRTIRTFERGRLVLLWQKPPLAPPQWGPNLITAPVDSDAKLLLHKWQQSQFVFEQLIARFTVDGDLVADPFAGSGTTLRAALTLGRRQWGADIERPRLNETRTADVAPH